MATEPKLTAASANLAANAVINTLGSSGFVAIFSGSVPATADTSGGTLLSLSSMASTAFSTAVSGVNTANAISTTTAINTGTASFFRFYVGATTGFSSGGVLQGLVAASGADLNFNSVAFSSGASIAITSFTYTQKTS